MRWHWVLKRALCMLHRGWLRPWLRPPTAVPPFHQFVRRSPEGKKAPSPGPKHKQRGNHLQAFHQFVLHSCHSASRSRARTRHRPSGPGAHPEPRATPPPTVHDVSHATHKQSKTWAEAYEIRIKTVKPSAPGPQPSAKSAYPGLSCMWAE